MSNRNYINGRNFEYVVKKKLESKGWTVWRTPGSRSKADLIAMKRINGMKQIETVGGYMYQEDIGSQVQLVQCKSGNARLSKKGKKEFLEFAQSVGAEAVYAYRPTPRTMKLEILDE